MERGWKTQFLDLKNVHLFPVIPVPIRVDSSYITTYTQHLLRITTTRALKYHMLIIPCIVNQFQKSSNKMTLLYSILLFTASRSICFG
jgi:hypothetical protein